LHIGLFHGTDFAVPYLPRRPSVMTLHDLSPWLDRAWQPSASRVRRRTPILLRAGICTMVITPSDAVRRAAIERFSLPPDRVAAIPLAAPEHFRPVDAAPQATPYFLFAGTLEPRKNLRRLIEAWREVRKTRQVDLVLAGRARSDFEPPPSEPGLRLLGAVPDEELPGLYSGAAACVYPSLYEGFGLPVLEAMQCGALVITSRDPAIAEVTGGGTATRIAIHVDAEDTRALVHALAAALDAPENFAAIRAKALKRARDFSWTRTAQRTREVYDAACRVFLAPETPSLTAGGGGMRAASLLEYLRRKYQVDVAGFTLPRHSRGPLARIGRNAVRFLRGRPPLLDGYSGFEDQVERQIRGHYRVAVIEHFWCAPYAATLRPHTDLLVLDLHNVESALARSHALAVRGLESAVFHRFAADYDRLEREWLPRFDVVLVASDEDRRRIQHRNAASLPSAAVYPNALPEIPLPDVPESNCIVFSGTLDYHPNVEAVRWFRSTIWPRIRERIPGLE
jgi:hypothetical protein